MSSLELQAAIQAHSAWKEQFEFLAAGVPGMPLNAQVAGDHQQCPLGRWLSSGGQTYTQHPLFAELIATHRSFHETAARIAELIGKQDFALADALLEGEFAQASRTIIEQLQQMRGIVKARYPDHAADSSGNEPASAA